MIGYVNKIKYHNTIQSYESGVHQFKLDASGGPSTW